MTPLASCSLTMLRCRAGKRAAKLWRRETNAPVCDPYDAGWLFSVDEWPVTDLGSLASSLERASRDPRRLLIRAKPKQGIDRQSTRRLLHDSIDKQTGEVTLATFEEVPRRWVLIDGDDISGPFRFDPRDGALAGLYFRSLLPGCFHGVSFWWQHIASAGFSPGVRIRLGFWLGRALVCDELQRLFAGSPIDPCTLRPVQVHYVSRPIFRDVADPVRWRSSVEWDYRDVVNVPALPEPELRQRIAAVQAQPRTSQSAQRLVDDAEALLSEVCAEVRACPAAGRHRWSTGTNGTGRHHALFCGALRLSGAIERGDLIRQRVERLLADAGLKAGLREPEEIERTILNGFACGGLT